MDLRQALTEETEYAVGFRGFTFYFTLRNPTNQEDLDYRRRSAKINLKNKNVETSDAALDAPLWLFEKIKTKAEYSNGELTESGEAKRDVIPTDLYQQIPQRMKLGIITKHMNDLEGEDAGEARKN